MEIRGINIKGINIKTFDVFDPGADPGLTGWYDASGLATNTDNAFGTVDASNKISNWKNLKGVSAWDLVQHDATKYPDLNVGGSYVHGALSSNDHLYILDQLWGVQFSWFAVVEVMAGVGSNNFMALNEGQNNTVFANVVSTNLNNPFQIVQSSTSTTPPNNTGHTTDLGDVSWVNGDKILIHAGFDYGGTDFYHKVDNVFKKGGATENTPNIPADKNIFAIGGQGKRLHPANPTVGFVTTYKIHELLIYSNQLITDTDPKHAEIYGYLSAKWGF